MDITYDPEHGVKCDQIAEQLKTDPRVKYLIFNRRIFKARTGKWEPYMGKNPHKSHLHVSIKPEARNDLSPWPWSPNGNASPSAPRTLKLLTPPDIMSGEYVLRVQKALGARGFTVEADGYYGINTEKAIRKFQEDNGLDADGIVGEKTRKALGL